jgi:hypothetical protein
MLKTLVTFGWMDASERMSKRGHGGVTAAWMSFPGSAHS